jgi:hypothetical protein
VVDPTPIERRFLAVIESLKRNDAINVNRVRKGAVSEVVKDSSAGFSVLEELFGVTLDPVLTNYHIRHSELGIHWYAAGTSVLGGGEFVLRELVDALISGPPNADDTRDDDERELFQQLRVVDYLPEGGSWSFSAVRLTGGTIAPRMWVYWFPLGAFALDLDYRGYLEALLLTRGFYGWQFLYADVRLAGMRYAPLVDLIRTGLGLLKEALPDRRYAELETRLAERLS